MYVPTETYLSSQDVVSTDDSERIILTFAGESPFILVQETNNRSDLETEYIYGDPCFVVDSIGALTDYSVTWINGTTEYYLVSDVMSQDELLNVAQSVNVLAVGK